MTKQAVEALKVDHAAIVQAAEGWTPEQWNSPSACEGWRVQDVLAHISTTYQQMVDPGGVSPVDDTLPMERQLDQMAAAIADLNPKDVLARFRDLGQQAIAGLEGLQSIDTPTPLGQLGTYPLHLLANAYAFDAYTHLRADILGPRGPLDGKAPTATADHLTAVMDWMFAGMPQMSPETLEPISETINLTIDGPGARTVNVTAGEVQDGTSAAAVASITTKAPDFVLWATKRESPHGLVEIDGDTPAATRFAEALHIF